MIRDHWDDYQWRLIHTPAQAPKLHMALDEVPTTEVGAGRRPPTLRIREWAEPAVIMGRLAARDGLIAASPFGAGRST